MMSASGGLKPRAVAGGPSVTRLTHNNCTGMRPSGCEHWGAGGGGTRLAKGQTPLNAAHKQLAGRERGATEWAEAYKADECRKEDRNDLANVGRDEVADEGLVGNMVRKIGWKRCRRRVEKGFRAVLKSASAAGCRLRRGCRLRLLTQGFKMCQVCDGNGMGR